MAAELALEPRAKDAPGRTDTAQSPTNEGTGSLLAESPVPIRSALSGRDYSVVPSVQPDTWFSRYAARDRLQLASLPWHFRAVMSCSHVVKESFGS